MWFVQVLEQYKPVVWEYARLNVSYNVLSKRKLNKLVTGGHVNGWDDPRLLTLSGLRRRGVTSKVHTTTPSLNLTQIVALQQTAEHAQGMRQTIFISDSVCQNCCKCSPCLCCKPLSDPAVTCQGGLEDKQGSIRHLHAQSHWTDMGILPSGSKQHALVLICASLSCKYRTDKQASAFILRIVNADAMVQGINDFCRSIGLTRTGGELPLHIMNYHIGRDLDANSPRTLAVLHPLRLVITNLPQDHLEMVQAKVNPAVACLPYTGRILPGHCCSLLVI